MKLSEIVGALEDRYLHKSAENVRKVVKILSQPNRREIMSTLEEELKKVRALSWGSIKFSKEKKGSYAKILAPILG